MSRPGSSADGACVRAAAILCAAILSFSAWDGVFARTSNQPEAADDARDGLFAPDRQQLLSYEDHDYSLRLARSNRRLFVDVFAGGRYQSRIPLPDEIVQVDAIRRVLANKVVVLGRLNGDVDGVAILNLDTHDVADAFLAYIPIASPDGRYIAYVKWFPPHYGGNVTHEYLLYDVAQSARQNRHASIGLDDFRSVGIPVFPRGAVNSDDDNLDVRDMHTMMSDTFYWRKDAKEYAFVDEDGSNRLSVVRIAVNDGKPVAKVARIAAAGYCSPNSDCQILVSHFRFGRGSVSLSLSGRTGEQLEPLVLKADQFK